MAQLFEHIIQSINNSELRIAIEKLFAIIGVGIGDKEGSVSVTGTLTGDVTGNVTGNVTGDQIGDSYGEHIDSTTVFNADTDMGDTDFASGVIILDGSTGTVALTNFTPTAGKLYTIFHSDSTNDASLACSSGVTINAAGNNTMSFTDAGDCIILKAITASRLVIVENIGSVALSTI